MVRIFISSTRTGLEEERDSLPGLITALGHDPVLFEQFTAKAVPSREACLAAVQAADAYLVLLGPCYGWDWKETGLSATHEEYRAARTRGLPRLAFRKLDVELEAAQRDFIDEIEAYATGLFRASFRTTAELLVEVAKVVRELERQPERLAWRRLTSPAPIAWRRDVRASSSRGTIGSAHVFEVYVRPVSPLPRTATQLRSDSKTIAETVRTLGVVDQSRPLQLDVSAERAVIEVGASGTRRQWNERTERELLGVEVDKDSQICTWQSLPRDHMGTLVDEALFVSAVADALRLAGQLGFTGRGEVVIAGALYPLMGLAEGDTSTVGRRNSAQMPMYRAEEVRTSADDAVTSAALSVGAVEAAQELSLRVLDSLRRARN